MTITSTQRAPVQSDDIYPAVVLTTATSAVSSRSSARTGDHVAESIESGSSSASKPAADETILSPTARLIAQALEGKPGDVAARSVKIAALQQSIAQGTYPVSSLDVAGKMMDSLFS
jgi:negative regulator of flagellin synthesis FlgM